MVYPGGEEIEIYGPALWRPTYPNLPCFFCFHGPHVKTHPRRAAKLQLCGASGIYIHIYVCVYGLILVSLLLPTLPFLTTSLWSQERYPCVPQYTPQVLVSRMRSALTRRVDLIPTNSVKQTLLVLMPLCVQQWKSNNLRRRSC